MNGELRASDTTKSRCPAREWVVDRQCPGSPCSLHDLLIRELMGSADSTHRHSSIVLMAGGGDSNKVSDCSLHALLLYRCPWRFI